MAMCVRVCTPSLAGTDIGGALYCSVLLLLMRRRMRDARRRAQSAIVNRFIQARAELNKPDKDGNTPLVRPGEGARPRTRMHVGYTRPWFMRWRAPQHLAVRCGFAGVARMLLAAGAEQLPNRCAMAMWRARCRSCSRLLRRPMVGWHDDDDDARRRRRRVCTVLDRSLLTSLATARRGKYLKSSMASSGRVCAKGRCERKMYSSCACTGVYGARRRKPPLPAGDTTGAKTSCEDKKNVSSPTRPLVTCLATDGDSPPVGAS
jgi:hypothetical protein